MKTESSPIISNIAPKPVGPYPHARQVGNLLFLSGIGPRKRNETEIPGVKLDSGGKVISYDVAVQTHSCIENIKSILEEAGLNLTHIVDIQVFLVNMTKDFASFNHVYAEYFSPLTGPCRTTIGVTALPTPIHVELKVIAAFPNQTA